MSFASPAGSTQQIETKDLPHTRVKLMNLASRTVLVTGANRGLGLALVNEALVRGAAKVYAGARGPLRGADGRIRALKLDVTNAAHIQRAAQDVDSLDVLVNNAGVDLHDGLGERAGLERHLAVNLFGTYEVTRAFLPLLARSRGAIVNVLSLAALAPVPFSPAYSISKSAALSLTQSLRSLWSARGMSVHAVLAGPVDTDMTRDLDIPKASAEAVARAIFDGLESGEDDIFPDPMSAQIAEAWRAGVPKALERQFAAYAPAGSADPA